MVCRLSVVSAPSSQRYDPMLGNLGSNQPTNETLHKLLQQADAGVLKDEGVSSQKH